MSTSDNYHIRPMTMSEVNDIALTWAAKEGWNPGLHDAISFYNTDPTGFLIGLLDDEPIACLSAVAYDSSFGFLGFYIVKQEYRGKGYGMKIWNEAMKYLGDRNISLDGVIDQIANYEKSGFKLAYNNLRYEGISRHSAESFPEILPLSEFTIDEILSYDSIHFPVPRRNFLRSWLRENESLAIGAKHDGKLAGYSVIRKCGIGYKTGPLFADSPELARELFQSVNNFIEVGAPIFLDTPEPNKEALALAESYGMKKVFGTARMYTQAQPDLDINRVFGVSSFELG
ncbi:MAG: GNAT family N-acetyltransferase [Bacteroidota bacterium]